ncbi:hypothetical protein M8C21_029790 [Ambrosia artemisiifolia]|uniref:Calcium permeable stress-gated cation channel 1 n=1 Tax=Ambrosia artemisiifolia TaxID=4212 RepID=A0AAD5G4U6_AMBAR|nr:hypothetical protein M8C21_029790 [Ambrosia artemisiifolia]
MATVSDITVSAAINSLSALLFLVAFAILRLQPVNDRVYFPKWYLKGIRENPSTSGASVKKFVNLDVKMYLRFLNWVPAALRMPEPELIEHAGLDSAVYIRIYLLGLKMFVPIALLAFAVLLPVNYTGGNFNTMSVNNKDLTFGEIDKFSISNVPPASKRSEYKIVTDMRLHFLASQKRRPDQFTVLVRNVPSDPDESVSEHVEHFFRVNHPDQYFLHKVVHNANKLAKMVEQKKDLQNRLIYYTNKHERKPNKRPTTKAGFWGLWGKKIDAIDYYTQEIEKLTKEELAERERVIDDPKSVVPAAFVSFRSRWGAAVCAQTQQTRNPTRWLTDWAPEPRDVYWNNLAIPFVELNLKIKTNQPNFQVKRMPETVGVSIPMKATFFITYIMVDGWAGVAAEILRVVPLVIYHLKNVFLVKTEKDRDEAMDPGSLLWPITEPRLQLYFLLGLVYSTVINVYNQKYESAASYWPDVHRHYIVRIAEHKRGSKLDTCTSRTPNLNLLDAMIKDTLERATEPQLDLQAYLKDAYMHPVFKGGEVEMMDVDDDDEDDDQHLVATKRSSRRGSQPGTQEGSPDDRTGGIHIV